MDIPEPRRNWDTVKIYWKIKSNWLKVPSTPFRENCLHIGQLLCVHIFVCLCVTHIKKGLCSSISSLLWKALKNTKMEEGQILWYISPLKKKFKILNTSCCPLKFLSPPTASVCHFLKITHGWVLCVRCPDGNYCFWICLWRCFYTRVAFESLECQSSSTLSNVVWIIQVFEKSIYKGKYSSIPCPVTEDIHLYSYIGAPGS